ncbi:hypothetical protein L5515_010039 [Caenorhabditis briggsae]|uniref:Transmembrane protein n=1 Tax=Caenorhabditis briggsae TaxID=6238 RepID=A0AAE9EQW1_CAEBR|nr:hypothetical protein L5515_010039 [Caenorhabditis briggsae]
MSLETLNSKSSRIIEFEEEENIEKQNERFSTTNSIFTAISCFIATLFIFLGVTEYKTCSEEKFIRIWLTTVGILLFFERIFSVSHELARLRYNSDSVVLMDAIETKKLTKKREKFNRRPLLPDLIWLLIVVLSVIGLVWLCIMQYGSSCDDLIFYSTSSFCVIILVVATVLILFVGLEKCCK